MLRELAIYVNDRASDEYRPKLAPLATDLVGTGPEPADPTEAQMLSVRLAVWACRRVEHPRFARKRPNGYSVVVL